MKRVSKEYEEYLKSPQWAQIRGKIIYRDGGVCRICGAREKLEVHHIRGKHRFHEQNHPEDLITLCDSCHVIIHGYFEQVDWQKSRYAEEDFKEKMRR